MRPFAHATIILAAAGMTYGSGAFPTASGSASIPPKMPACWGQCFGQFNVSGTPEMLCSPKISGFVEQCIKVSCEAADEPAAATQYSSWLHSFCGGHNPFPSGSGYIEPPTPSTSSAPVIEPTSSEPVVESTSSEPVVEPTLSASISETPSSSAPIGGQPPVPVFTGTGGHHPFPPSGTGIPGRPPMPSCWQTCFTESNITYPEALCFEHPGTEVSQCIQATCQNSAETNAYYQWVQKFCSPATTGVHSASTSSYSESLSSSVPSSSSESSSSSLSTSSSSSASSSTASVSHSVPAFPGTGHPPVGTGSPKPPTFPPMPPCWQSCFTQFNISNPESLCHGYPGTAVSECIKSGCEANSTQAYFGWVQSFCLGSTASASPVPSTSSSASVSESSPASPETPSSSSEIVEPSSSVPVVISSSAPAFPHGTAPPFPHGTGVPSHPSMPPCWGRCFAQYNISSPQALCSRHPGNMVHSCISTACAANETAQYDGWVRSACHVGTGTGVLPSTSSSASSSVPESTSSASSSVPTESSSIPESSVVVHPTGGEPTFPTGGFPHPTGGASYPPCWGQCFAQSHVYSPAALCAPEVGAVVGECINQSCNTEDAGRYNTWQQSFCNHVIVPTGSGVSHSSSPVPSTSSSALMEPTSSSVPSSSSYAPTEPASSSIVVPPHGTGSPHPPSTNHTMPQCWTQCFQAYHVNDPSALCSPSMGGAVDNCISSVCNGTDAARFDGWKHSFCNSTLPSGTGVSSSSYSIEPTVSASASSSTPIDPTTPPSSSIPESSPTSSSAPLGTGSHPQPTGGAHPPPGGNYTMPSCWVGCFQQFNVSDPRALCAPSLGPLVDTCISTRCNATESGKYSWWLNDFCRKPVPTGSSSYSFSIPVVTVSSSESISASATVSASTTPSVSGDPVSHTVSETVPVGTGGLPPFPPTGTGVPSHPQMPGCWSKCFAENHVTSPASLCHPPLGPVVDGCISSGCTNGTDAAGYNGWLQRFCNSTAPIPSGSALPSTSSNAVSSSTNSQPISTSSSSSTIVDPISSSSVSYSTPVGPSGTAPPFPPSGTGIPHPPGSNFPTCWGACFAQNHIVSKSALCVQPTKDAVSSCITQSCAANETAQYSSWVTGFCPASTGSSSAPEATGSSSTVVDPVTNSASSSSWSISVTGSASVSDSASSIISTSSIAIPTNSSVPVPPTNGTQIPTCWTTCFSEHNVPSKDALCDPELTAYVAACIEGSCEAGSSDKYAHWVGGYCDAPTPPSHSMPPVVEPSATASASPSASESVIVTSSSSVVIVDPVASTSSSTPSSTPMESSEAPSSTIGGSQGPPTGRPQGPPTGRPQGPPTGRPQGPPTGRPGEPGRPTTELTPTIPPPVEDTPSPTTPVQEEPAPTTTSSSSTSSAASPVDPTHPLVTEDPATVTIPSTPTTITQHPTPTTMTTAVKPTTTKQPAGPPTGPPAGYGRPGEAPWGNGPPPWVKNVHGPPPPEIFKSVIEKLKGVFAGMRG